MIQSPASDKRGTGSFSLHQTRVHFSWLSCCQKAFFRLYENFVMILVVPDDKASNNYTFVWKKHYVDIQIEELGHHSLLGILPKILQIYLHQMFLKTIDRISLPLKYRQMMMSSICLTKDAEKSIWTQTHCGFTSVPPSLYPLYLRTAYTYRLRDSFIHSLITKKPYSFYSLLKKCGSWRIQRN